MKDFLFPYFFNLNLILIKMDYFDYNRLCTKFESAALVSNFINHSLDFKDDEKLKFYHKVS